MIKTDRSGKDWIRFTLLTILTMVMLLVSDLSAKEKRNYQGLLAGNGADLVLENCTLCHSTEIIRENHMSREAWDKTITWMQEKQGLWDLGKDRKTILDYLSNAQGEEKNKATGREGNSMYEFNYPANPL
tara:strand:+ start:245 stop:634 length:390 start_codon:yes stop_codon:yes gene_type:complete